MSRIQRVVLEEDRVDQMMELGGDLDTGRPGSGDDDGQQLAPADGITLGDRPFDEANDVVADPHRIGHRRERQTVGLDRGIAEEERDAAQRHDQIIVGNRGAPGLNGSSVEIEPGHLRLEKVKPGFPRQEPERIAHMGRTQRRGRDFGQQRREREIVPLVDEGDLGQLGLVLSHRQRRVQPGKASSDDHDPGGFLANRRHRVILRGAPVHEGNTRASSRWS